LHTAQSETINRFQSTFDVQPDSRIVAIELAGDDEVRIYRRLQGRITEERATFQPWLVVPSSVARRLGSVVDEIRLNGDARLNTLVKFQRWSRWRDAFRRIRDQELPALAFPSPAEQYLTLSRELLFGGLEFDDLVRAQIDIETLGLDPRAPDGRIVLVTAAVNGQEPFLLRGDELDEAGLISGLSEWIQRVDPDVIEGHNVFNFDIPFLVERGRRHGLQLQWGRDGSAVRIGSAQRFKAGARSIPYDPVYVYGRHVVDTYQQIQRYDAAGLLASYGLKAAIDALGLTRDDRAFVAGDEIGYAWEHDRERLVKYAIDDVLDTNVLSELALPTEFYQAQLLPRGLQSVATGGPGEKINDLLTRAYLLRRESIPLPDEPRPYPGGFTAVRAVGSFGPIVKADVESLYPAIMLRDRIAPASDHLGVFLPMLAVLTERRLEAKRNAQLTERHAQARWHGIQLSLKVLINSFYGYLGYSRAYFSDFNAAERVTLAGHQVIQQVERELEQRGARIIEIDTDGVYFQPASSSSTFDDEQCLIDEISLATGDGIRLAHDGRWRAMLSLRLKNYALLGYDDRITLKGSGLRNRREEPLLRRFIQDLSRSFLAPDDEPAVRERYLTYAEQILASAWPPEDIARTETVSEASRNTELGRRLIAAVGQARVGERVTVYQRADSSFAPIEDYAHDEDRVYLLRRLRDTAERFRVLYDEDTAFEYEFPIVSLATDLAQLRASAPVSQPRLF